VADKFKVTFTVAEPTEQPNSIKASRPVLNFIGETDLSLTELRDVLSFVVTGVRADTRELIKDLLHPTPSPAELVPFTSESSLLTDILPLDTSEEPTTAPQEVSRAKKRRRNKHRQLIPRVCVHCDRRFMAYTTRQYVCSRPECQAWRMKQNDHGKNRSDLAKLSQGHGSAKPRKRPTPNIEAVCESCGDKFMAYTTYQRVCGKPECRAWRQTAPIKHHLKRGGTRGWEPQIVIDTDRGVIKGSALMPPE
jgi:hypothetical protein